jgi:hypothetical protein
MYINYVKTLNRFKGDGNYYEEHHIIPKSLGGSNDKDNLVLLTAREHFLAHYLLYKFNKCSETLNAFIMMQNRGIYKTSKLYENSRKEFSKYMSEHNPSKFRTQEVIDRVANWHRGRKRSPETCKRISEANKGQKAWNKGLKYKIGPNAQLSEKLRKSWDSNPRKGKLVKPSRQVKCLETNQVYSSAKQAAELLNLSRTQVRYSCRKQGNVSRTKLHFIYLI